MELFLVFIIWLALGATTAYLANLRGRDPFMWSMLILFLSLFGIPFAVIGLGFLYFLPPVDEEDVQTEPLSELPAPSISKMSVEDISKKLWYFYDLTRQQQGPLSFKDLQLAWKKGDLSADSFIWTEGMDGWKKTISLPEVVDALNEASTKAVDDLS